MPTVPPIPSPRNYARKSAPCSKINKLSSYFPNSKQMNLKGYNVWSFFAPFHQTMTPRTQQYFYQPDLNLQNRRNLRIVVLFPPSQQGLALRWSANKIHPLVNPIS